jgi:hypothetical protein
MLSSRARGEEKLLLRAFQERGVPVTVLDDRAIAVLRGALRRLFRDG